MNRINEYKAFVRYLKYMRKDIELCKSKCKSFCKKIPSEINSIKVFGMSLGEVDIPYLRLIHELCPNIKWEVSYYNDDSKDRIDNIIKESLGIDELKYTFFKFHNPSSKKIIAKIINEHGFELH